MKPYTRDTFGIAIKATYAEDKDGNPLMIYKAPKEASFKKSQKGCCIVRGEPGNYSYEDEKTYQESLCSDNQLIKVFEDGRITKDYSLDSIIQNLYNNKF